MILGPKELEEYTDEQLMENLAKLQSMTAILGAGPTSGGGRMMAAIQMELQRRANLRRPRTITIREER